MSKRFVKNSQIRQKLSADIANYKLKNEPFE